MAQPKGFITTKKTMPIISTVGTSLMMRYQRPGRLLASRAKIFHHPRQIDVACQQKDDKQRLGMQPA